MLTLLTMQNRLDSVLHLTVNQKPNGDDLAKAREVIEIRGTGNLTLHDRRVIDTLYANAGQKICDDVNHVIGLSELRGSHKGGERVKDFHHTPHDHSSAGSGHGPQRQRGDEACPGSLGYYDERR